MESDWIDYYCRNKLFKKVTEIANKISGDAKWKLYSGMGLVLGGKALEGISYLEPLLSHSNMGLSAAVLSLVAHQSCESVDREAVTQLEWKVEEGCNAGEKAQQYAAAALIYAGDYVKARTYVDRLLRFNTSSASGHVLNGWLEFYSNNHRAAARSFKTALALDKSNVEGILGEIASTGDSLGQLNQLIVRYPKIAPPLVEKMWLQLSSRDWAQAVDTATRVLTLEPNNLAALELKALHQLVAVGDYNEAAIAVRRYAEELDEEEEALVTAAQLFSRVCGRDNAVLAETSRMAEQATQLHPHSVKALLEMASQHRLAGRLTDAARLCRAATRLDSASPAALTELTAILLAQTGLTQQVQQQVEFLTEVVGSRPHPQLLVLRAQCEDDYLLLDQAAELLRSEADSCNYGSRRLLLLNPELMMDIASHYQDIEEGLSKRACVLTRVVEDCPGLVKAVLALARTHVAASDLDAAAHIAQHLLAQIDSTNTDAHLILAQIYLSQEKYQEANASLELGLSYNLQVRERPLYHVLLGAIQRYHDDAAACVQSMRTALSLNTGEHKLTVSELGTLYLELVTGMAEIGQAQEAEDVLHEAMASLQGTGQEGRLTVVEGDLAAVRGDYRAALTILAAIQPDQPFYLQARKKMATLHLEKLKDGQAYADCYKEMVVKNPSTENLLLLGDAYMAIQEPELAVDTYEKAMKGSNSSPELSVRLGRVLVRTHQYGKAIKCFREAGDVGSMELAHLLMRLRQLEAAESTLSNLPLSQKALLLAKIKEKAGDVSGAVSVVKEAREALGASEVLMNSKMCAQLAEYANIQRDYDTAITYYKRALQYNPEDTHTEIALSKLYMQVNDWSACQSVCSTLLSREPDNEPALLMLADLAYRRVQFHDAAGHFSSLLTRHPDYWVALARLIEVKRRTAQLDDVKPFLEMANRVAPNHPGLAYCKGLDEWYSGNVNSALHHFNNARIDSEWGQQALHNMVELCLAGDNGVSTATKLLGHMHPHSPEEQCNVRLLHNMVLMTTKDRQDVELAMADLTNLASQDTLRVGATYGLATGYLLQKQTARARNVLKRVAKAVWTVEDAEALEKCWLQLADLHVQTGKHDPAAELLRRTLAHNQSCHRAHQLLALIAEKEQKYLEASQYYRNAWKPSGENDPALGFKLAFNQVKAKRYADAISTCNAVLKLDRDYPRIRKEILEKAVGHLRT